MDVNSESKIHGDHGRGVKTNFTTKLESLQQQKEYPENLNISSSGRHQSSSIYSLTLDGFQNTLFHDSRKELASMNMDEFLDSICNAAADDEENEDFLSLNKSSSSPPSETKIHLPLPRQGSSLITFPATLSLKTVEQVWSEIYPTPAPPLPNTTTTTNNNNHPSPATTTRRQSTFGEMTLEDFLVKAGVVREAVPCGSSSKKRLPAPVPISQHYPLHNDPEFGTRSIVDHGLSDNQDGTANSVIQADGMGTGVGYGSAGQMLSTRQVKPLTPGGLMCKSQVNRYGVELGGGTRGRKRNGIEGPVEKVVERRHRRMIKNREAASRSRARKQAYTVELEAALDQLKEENALLNRTLLRERKGKPPTKLPTITKKMKLRRMWSLST